MTPSSCVIELELAAGVSQMPHRTSVYTFYAGRNEDIDPGQVNQEVMHGA